MSWLVATFFKKFILFGYHIFCQSCNFAAWKFMPECWLKRMLLQNLDTRINPTLLKIFFIVMLLFMGYRP
jgi:hypothetical protein